MPPKDWDFIIHAMVSIISAPDGTGWRFGRDTPYSVAAKTGTAQVYTVRQGSSYSEAALPKKLRDNSLFIAFAPVDHPKIAVAIVVEHAESAPIIARKMMDYYLVTEQNLKNKEHEITHKHS